MDVGKITCILSCKILKCNKLNHALSMNNIIDNNLYNCGEIEICPQYTILRNSLDFFVIFKIFTYSIFYIL